VTRLLAAIVAPVVVVLAVVAWGPARGGADPMTSLADISVAGPPLRVAADPGVAVPIQRSGTARTGASRAVDESSLAVSIDAMTPSVVPQRGPLVIRGRVTNTTGETWSGINVYPCTSARPMTSAAELREAVESDPELEVCTRTRYFETIPDLGPGDTGSYTLRVDRDELGIPTAPGVYWMNVQVLGTTSAGRDGVSDGRARGFLPLGDRGAAPVTTSVILPLRRSTLRDADGRVADADGWAVDLAAGGRLHNLLTFVENAEDTPLSLVVDPAVLVAVRQLAAGNPPRDLESTASGTDEDEDAEPEEPEPDAEARSAQEWLERLVTEAARHPVLGLPYGDLDLAAAAQYDAAAYERATEVSAQAFEEFGITASTAVVPPSGLLSEAGLALADDARTVLLSSDALPEELALAEPPPAAITVDGRPVGVYDDSVGRGGPGPNNRLSAVSLRQRVLAEAALRSLNDDDRPLVVSLPSDIDPGRSTAAFFRGLDRAFVSLDDDLLLSADAPAVEEVTYPQRQVDRELWASNFENALKLGASGAVLDRLLPENDTVASEVEREALSTTSYTLRDDPYAAAAAAASSASWIDSRLARVTISAPEFVILSSDSGPFSVTVANGLDQPVRIKIRARTRGGLEIKAPELIELEADTKQTVTLSATSDSIGVHPVTLVATDEELVPLGASEEISIRSNQVGRVIWVIMGAGGGILFLAIAIRLTRRIRRARAS
jgi:hypothetical protein